MQRAWIVLIAVAAASGCADSIFDSRPTPTSVGVVGGSSTGAPAMTSGLSTVGSMGTTEDGGDSTGPGQDASSSGSAMPVTTSGDTCGGVTCDANAACLGEQCECNSGFEGDGLSCVDIDGCMEVPCFDGVECTDAVAPEEGFGCGSCPLGYDGDGIDCADADGCAPEPCFAGVECTDVIVPGEGFFCDGCPAGFEGDGQLCEDIDGCAADPCFAGVACMDVVAPDVGFTCGPCPAGLFGDGITCTNGQLFSIGGQMNSSALGPYFRANGYVADADGTVPNFDVYMGFSAACSVDFYVFQSALPGGALTQVWRSSNVVAAGTGYINSGPVNLAVTSGQYYALGIGWNCSATYYWDTSGWAGTDAGVGIFNNTRWDNGYPGPSDAYVPPNTGAGGTAYDHRILWSGP